MAIKGLAEWLDAEMARRGLTNADLSRLTGIGDFTISRLRTGKREGKDWDTLIALAQGLGMTLVELICAVADQPVPPQGHRDRTTESIRLDPNLTSFQRDSMLVHYRTYVRPRGHGSP